MKRQGSGQMLGEVSGVMAPRIDMEFTRDVARGENFVESLRARIKAEVVFISTIEVDFQTRKVCPAGHGNGTVLIPKGRIGRAAENAPEHARSRRVGRGTSKKSR